MARTEEIPLLTVAGLSVYPAEVEWLAMRAQGSGGQNLHKTESAVQLRYNVASSRLPDEVKERLRARRDRRIGEDGLLLIKAQRARSQDRNRAEALGRLAELLASVAEAPKLRKPTKPSRAAKQRRLDEKSHRGRVKSQRGKVLE